MWRIFFLYLKKQVFSVIPYLTRIQSLNENKLIFNSLEKKTILKQS